MINHIKKVIAEYLASIMQPKLGTITAYNPQTYTVKVMIQPEGVETGFIQIATPWAGSNFGAVFGPAIGDLVRLDFIEGSVQAGLMGGRFFNNANPPPVVQSGQCAIVDKGGSSIKLNADGTITLSAPIGITSTTPILTQNGNLTVNGNVAITGTELVSGAITGQGGIAVSGGSGASVTGNMTITAGDVKADSISLKNHTHADPQGGNTGPAQ